MIFSVRCTCARWDVFHFKFIELSRKYKYSWVQVLLIPFLFSKMIATMLIWIIYSCTFLHVFATNSFSCPAGFFCSKITGRSGGVERDYKITPCPIGTYSQHGEGVCKSCDPGYYTVQNGSASCKPCPPGHECQKPDGNPRACRIGTYSSCIAQSVCTPCPTGKFTAEVAATHCISCPAGSMCDPNSNYSGKNSL